MICVTVLLISLLSIGTRSIAHKVLCYTQSIVSILLLFVQREQREQRELDSTYRSANNVLSYCTCRYSLLQIKVFTTLICGGVLRSMLFI